MFRVLLCVLNLHHFVCLFASGHWLLGEQQPNLYLEVCFQSLETPES